MDDYSDFKPRSTSSPTREDDIRSKQILLQDEFPTSMTPKVYIHTKNMLLHIPVPNAKELTISETKTTFTITMQKIPNHESKPLLEELDENSSENETEDGTEDETENESDNEHK